MYGGNSGSVRRQQRVDEQAQCCGRARVPRSPAAPLWPAVVSHGGADYHPKCDGRGHTAVALDQPRGDEHPLTRRAGVIVLDRAVPSQSVRWQVIAQAWRAGRSDLDSCNDRCSAGTSPNQAHCRWQPENALTCSAARPMPPRPGRPAGTVDNQNMRAYSMRAYYSSLRRPKAHVDRYSHRRLRRNQPDRL